MLSILLGIGFSIDALKLACTLTPPVFIVTKQPKPHKVGCETTTPIRRPD